MFASLDKFPLKTILIFLLAIIGLNITYYQHSKIILINHQKEKINIFTSTIASEIVKQSEGEAAFDERLARDLRTASVAIKQSLAPDFHQVTNEQLVELSKLLQLDGISLFERQGDDFIGVRSSDPKEIGVSSKTWGIAHEAQLLLSERKPVNIGTGFSLENYWSGPIDTAATDESNIRKWGRYFDGTTNYLIIPYLNVTSSITQYREKVGVEMSIQEMLKAENENLLEIAVLNPEKVFDKEPPRLSRDNFYSERLVENGSYTYRDESEELKMKEALASKTTIYYNITIQGKSILKSITPIDTSNLKYKRDNLPKVVVVATDNSKIENTIKQQLRDITVFMILVTVLAGFVISVLFRITRRKNEGTVRTVQDVYLDNINSIVQSIKEQRHDIINHLTAISWMVRLKKYDSLHDYITPLIQDAKLMEYKIKAVEINIPALSGIIQAKLAQSEVYNIDMQVEFTNMENLRLTTIKTTDLVRIISNLIDNSFDATIELPIEERRVSIEGTVRANQLFLQVENSCLPLSPDSQSKMFESGFSTKQGKQNKGLGLHIIKQLIERYRGTIDFSSEENGIIFSIVIPLKQDK